MGEKLLATREVSQILEISEKDVIALTKLNKIPHFKIAGEFLRFKKDDIQQLKEEIQTKFNIHKEKVPQSEQLREFLRFNDFYLVSSLVIMLLLWTIFKG